MSALGQTQTFGDSKRMSALPPKASRAAKSAMGTCGLMPISQVNTVCCSPPGSGLSVGPVHDRVL
jgi:hypothetical protein